MAQFNWVTDIGVPALVSMVTTVIGFSTLLTKLVEKRIDLQYSKQLKELERQNNEKLQHLQFRYDSQLKDLEFRYSQILAAQQSADTEQLEMLKMLPQGVSTANKLVLTPAVVIRNQLRAVYKGEEININAVMGSVGTSADKLADALQTSRDSLLMFSLLDQAHAIKNDVLSIKGRLKHGQIILEKENHDLGQVIDDLTEQINKMQDCIKQWIPAPHKKSGGLTVHEISKTN
jgi:hypothetical protein